MRSCFPLVALALALPTMAVAQKSAEEQGDIELPPPPTGSDPSPTTGQAKVPEGADFGEGLKQLAALGLPDLKDAQWMRVAKKQSDEFFGSYITQYHFREVEVKLQGGYWKLAGEAGELLDFGAVEAFEPEGAEGENEGAEEGEIEEKKAEPGLLQKMLKNYSEKNPPKEVEKPAAPDVEADAKALAAALGRDKLRRTIESRQEYSPSDVPGRCLIFAAQLHAAGKTAAANQLAAAVFSLPIDKEQIINGAVSQFADAAYEKAAKDFTVKHDWAAYRDAVKAALAKYPRGWSQAGGVAMLLPLLEKRAAGVLPPAPSLPGIELKPEAVAALDQLLAPPSDKEAEVDDEALARSHGVDLNRFPAAQRARILAQLRSQGIGDHEESYGSGLWLLNKHAEVPPAGDPLARLVTMKMDGFIALAAVAADDTLVISASPPDYDRDSYSYSYSSRNRSVEEEARQAFEGLARPKTRGELASALLESALPGGEGGSSGEDQDAAGMAAAAVEFWKAHRGDSEVQLALVYLTQGDEGQQMMASQYLAKHSDPAAHAAFEKAVLDSDTPSSSARDVTTYIEQRKAAARPFFEAYSKALKAELDGVDIGKMSYDSGSYAIREAGSVDKFLKTLGVKVGATSLKEMIEAAIKSRETAEMQGVATALRGTAMTECLQVLAEPAARADPEMLMQIFQVLMQRTYQDRRNRGSAAFNEEPKEKPSAELIALWRPVMERGEAVPETDPKDGYFASWVRGYGGKTCGDATILMLELAIYPGSGEALNSYVDIQGGAFETVYPFVRSRVEAWTTDKSPPPWPEAKKVGEERKKEIAAQLAAKPAGELAAYAASLSPDERMTLAEIVRGYTAEAPAPAGVTELRAKVTARRAYNTMLSHDNAILDQLGIADGYELSAEKLEEIAGRLAREAKDRSGTQIAFFSGPMGLGCVASANRAADPRKMNLRGRTNPLPGYFKQFGDPESLVMLQSEMGYEFWSLKDGTLKHEGNEEHRQTWEQLKANFKEKLGPLPHMTLQVMSREDAEKMNKPQEEEEEE